MRKLVLLGLLMLTACGDPAAIPLTPEQQIEQEQVCINGNLDFNTMDEKGYINGPYRVISVWCLPKARH